MLSKRVEIGDKFLRDKLVEYIQNLERIESIKAILLFGSAAMGKARFNSEYQSDLDLIIIVEDIPEDFHQRIKFIREKGLESPWVKGIWYTPKEISYLVESKPPYILDALIHGKILLDKDNFLTTMRKKLVKDLEKKGVVETSHAWIWPWKGFKEPVVF